MTTIKLRFRPSSIAGKEGTLYYQIIRLRKVAMISTGFHIFRMNGMRNVQKSLLRRGRRVMM